MNARQMAIWTAHRRHECRPVRQGRSCECTARIVQAGGRSQMAPRAVVSNDHRPEGGTYDTTLDPISPNFDIRSWA